MLKSMGMVRKTDTLGRIVLPMSVRKMLDIQEGAPMEIFATESEIVLRKYDPGCSTCGSLENITYFKGKKFCTECLTELKNK